jgi:subtilisin family serine protease
MSAAHLGPTDDPVRGSKPRGEHMSKRGARYARIAAVIALTAAALLAGSSAAAGAEAPQEAESYIVVLEDSVRTPNVVAARHASDIGAAIKGVYSHALKGYSADLTADEVAQLRADPSVAYVQRDRVLTIQQAGQQVPTGVRRIFAPDNPNLDIDGQDDVRVDVDVAVIDTGVLAHSDLNVVARTNCSSGFCQNGSGNDDNGHGTHVAGTVAALDNNIGVVGVAPGARIHSVKVCGAGGQCFNSAIIAGVDWVTARASSIEVANMSLGGPGTNSALNQAITRSINAGVVYAVAAGNSDQDARNFSPASHPDVITVSALADFNGLPGGGASPTCRSDQDDTLASFSNWGPAVEIAAPGVCIRSTWNNGGYNTISGTSMASPHAAGAAAILASGPRDPTSRSDVLAIRQRIVDTGNSNWTDDSGDGIKEPLLDVGDSSQYPPDGGPPPPPPDTVFSDNFETATGWTTNPNGTDTATTGVWERGDPQGTSYSGTTLQLGTTTSGVNDLVTGSLAGSSVGANDLDGGVTSIQSPLISLPSGGTLALSAQWYLGHLNNATSADFFRISVVSGSSTTTVFQQLGASTNRSGSWGTATANLSSFAGQSIRLLIQAADAGSGSLVEAGVDDVVITHQT